MIITKRVLRLNLIVFLNIFLFSSYSQNTFIQNKGQFPESVVAKVNIPSGNLFIESGRLTYSFYSGHQLKKNHDLQSYNNGIKAHAYRINFLKFNNSLTSQLKEESKYYENYYLGEESRWAENVRSYKSLTQNNIYEGIDIKYYIYNNKLKYDFVISPFASPEKISFQYEGVEKVELFKENIYVTTQVNTVIEHAPYAYQIIDGKEVEVLCQYVLKKNIVSFIFPEGYNINYALVIDPTLDFSTYSGSASDNFGYTATYDKTGFLYAGSTAFGSGYPTTLGAYQTNYANSLGGTDIAITKYDTTGTQRTYSTYLGGNFDELPHSMIVNSDNELFIYGTTGSSDFPTTTSAFQNNFNQGASLTPAIGVSFPEGTDIFVSKISSDGGNLLASTFIGGSDNDGLNTADKLKFNYADEVRGEIDIDNQNNIYIATCTRSSDFPTTNSFQSDLRGGQEGCVIKMDNNLTTIIWCSYLGGSGDDAIYSLALDDNDNIYVTGGTTSIDFSVTQNTYQQTHQNSLEADAFITKISANGTQIISSSYFGTEYYDQSYFVEIGSKNQVYLFGQTKASGIQLVSNAPYFVPDAGQFIVVFNSNLTNIIRSTVFGSGKGTPDISPTAFLVDVCDKIYIAGWGSALGGQLSTLNLPVSTQALQQNTDGNDMYLMVFDELLSTIIYATYFGGTQSSEHVDGGTSRFDKRGIIYQAVCAGCGGNSDFPIEPVPGAVSETNNSTNCNNAVFKFNFDFSIVLADFQPPGVTCETAITFENLTNSSATTTYEWSFGDGNTSTDKNPTHEYSEGGLYNVTLIASDIGTCNIKDTIVRQIYILSNNSDTLSEVVKCPFENAQIGMPSVHDTLLTYNWSPTSNLSNTNISNPYTNIDNDQYYQLFISDGFCTDTLYQQVKITKLELEAGNDTIFCHDTIVLEASFSNSVNFIQWSNSYNFLDTLSNTFDVSIVGSQMVYVKASSDLCVEIDSIFVQTDSIDIAMVSNDICEGDSAIIEVVNLMPFSSIVSYNWEDLSFNNNIIFDFPDTSRWYFIEVVNENNCIARDSVFVNVNTKPEIDSIWTIEDNFYEGESAYIYILTETYIDSTLIFIEEPSWYYLTIENQQGCLAKDSVFIDVKEVNCSATNFIIPNAFTPFSSQGYNDTFFIKEIKQGLVTKYNLEIYNRYGQLVFKTNDIEHGWDGTFKNQELTPQVFDFYVEITCIGEVEFFYKGNITLIR